MFTQPQHTTSPQSPSPPNQHPLPSEVHERIRVLQNNRPFKIPEANRLKKGHQQARVIVTVKEQLFAGKKHEGKLHERQSGDDELKAYDVQQCEGWAEE
jgi:translation elongation factor P/translation initiation factor 5A